MSSNLPASPITIGLFLTEIISTKPSTSTLDAYMYAIKWAHEVCGLEDPTIAPFPALVYKGGLRTLGRPITKKEPITSEIVRALCSQYGGSEASLRDSRFLTMALLAYSGFLRFNELQNIKRSHLQIYDEHMSLFIPRSKTDVYSTGSTILISKGLVQSTCPKARVVNYLNNSNSCSDNDYYIFRNIIRKGGDQLLTKINKPITYARAREELLSYLSTVVDNNWRYGWHSFRRGGATKAANSNVADRLFKKHGRWSSEAAKDGYVDEDREAMLLVSKSLQL